MARSPKFVQNMVFFTVCFLTSKKCVTAEELGDTMSEEDEIIFKEENACKDEEFACGNSSCLDRSLHCDGNSDCDNGEDEENCSDVHGSLKSLLKAITKHQELKDVLLDKSIQFDNCSLTDTPSFCVCRFFTFIYCENFNLTSVPDGIHKMVTKLVLTNNSLRFLPPRAFSNLYNLKIIHIEGNQIPVLTPGPFLGMHNVTFLLLMRNQIKFIKPGAFKGLQNLRWLLMQGNLLEELNMTVFMDLPYIEFLDLTENKLRVLKEFSSFERLIWLGLGKNKITLIKEKTFRLLTSLEVLILKDNLIEDIQERAFSSLNKLLELDISKNKITFIRPGLFSKLKNLNKLNLEFNLITSFPHDVFKGLGSLKSLDLQGLDIMNIDTDLFFPLKALKFIYFKKFIYCSYAPKVRICKPVSDGISSTEHLLVWPLLRLFVWVVSLLTIAGNTLVIIWRMVSHREDKVLSLFIKNLAFADLLMGVYLLAIGAKDISFREKYNYFSHEWMLSWQCSFLGVLAMVSSEVTVFILSVITIERHRCIRTNVRFVSVTGAKHCLVTIWFVGFILAIIPVFKYTEDQGFYQSNGLCFPLHIDDPFTLGYEYSAFLFCGINFSAVMLTIFLYINMFATIKRDREFARPVLLKKNEDAILALRFFSIVITDSLCWVPIVIIKLLALFGVPISRNLYAALIVLILPINSALNPILYTIAAPTELRRRIEKWLLRMPIWLRRFDCILKTTSVAKNSNPRHNAPPVCVPENRFIPSGNKPYELEMCITTI